MHEAPVDAPVLGPGSTHATQEELVHAQHRVAAWVEAFCLRAYGPRGGAKLVDDTWLESGASALRELGPVGPLMMPYVRLATTVGQIAGDQATAAVLVASGMVRRVLDAGPRVRRSIPEAAPLVERQAAGAVHASAEPDRLGDSLRGMWRPDAADAVLEGLAQARRAGAALDLDRVHIIVEAARAATWHKASHVPVEGRPAPGRHSVWILTAAPRKLSAGATLRTPEDVAAFVQAEHDALGPWRQALRGAALVVCRGGMGDLGEDLRHNGTLVWEDAGRDACLRLAAATGAVPAPDPTSARAGRGTLERRRQGGWWLNGAGPAWTLLVPGAGVTASAARDGAERLLRAAGAWAEDPRSVPGAGTWQRETAASLRRAAPLAPRRTPFVFEALADTLENMADHVPEGSTRDLAPAVELALDAGLRTAFLQLRIDAMIAKRPSSVTGLRGTEAPSRDRVRAGDVPPLM